jgi:dipeptidyl aminopeptidase/acylaminoacyl peptidase
VIYPEAAPLPGGGAVVVAHSYLRPPEIAVAECGSLRTILSLGHEGTDYQLGLRGSIRELSWRAMDGLEIEGLLCQPSSGGPHPLVVHIHGGPVYAFRNSWGMMMGAEDLVPGMVSRGFAVLNVNPRGSGGRGIDFASRVYGDPGGADAADILAGVDHLVDAGLVDAGRVAVTGRSYGGFMSAWLVTQTDRFAAAIPRAPVTDWYSFHHTSNVSALTPPLLGDSPRGTGKAHERSPVMHAARVRTPVLVMAGALDRCAPPTQAVEFHHALIEHGVDATLVIYPEEGHHVLRYEAKIDELTRIVDFLERHLTTE